MTTYEIVSLAVQALTPITVIGVIFVRNQALLHQSVKNIEENTPIQKLLERMIDEELINGTK